MSTNTIQVAPPGLKGLIVAETEIGEVQGARGFYHYRQYEATSLVRSRSLEDIWYLLLNGRLPTEDEAVQFAKIVAEARVLSPDVASLIRSIGLNVPSLHLGAIAAVPLILNDTRPSLDQTPQERTDDVIRIASALPTVFAILASARGDGHEVTPNPNLSHAADWLSMATGGEPSGLAVRGVETYLSSTIDHGFNASTFTTRVVTSTGADIASAMAAGLGALSGPLHGGAPSLALAMIDSIGDPTNTEAWVQAKLDSGSKIMGFGHAVYKADDPRSVLLRDIALEFDTELVHRAINIEARVLSVMRRWKPDAVIVTNVEFYAGIVLHLSGLPAEMFTPSFMASRSIGWGAHILEQAANNKIIRPSARYTGPEPRPLT